MDVSAVGVWALLPGRRLRPVRTRTQAGQYGHVPVTGWLNGASGGVGWPGPTASPHRLVDQQGTGLGVAHGLDAFAFFAGEQGGAGHGSPP